MVDTLQSFHIMGEHDIDDNNNSKQPHFQNRNAVVVEVIGDWD